MTIQNYTSCEYIITLFAQSATMSYPYSVGCSDIEANFIVPPYTTYSWADPYDLESGYLGGSLGGVGWIYLVSPYTTVCGTSCYPLAAWSGYYPSDWTWSWCSVDNSCYSPPSIIGQFGVGCGYPNYIGPGCSYCVTSTNAAVWQQSMTFPYDVLIIIVP